MKFVFTMICKLCLLLIIPTQSRHGEDEYYAGATVYRGVLGCGEQYSGEVIYDAPSNPQAWESWTIPVINCSVNISTCYPSVGDEIGLALIEQRLRWDDYSQRSVGCPGSGPGSNNTLYSNRDLSPNTQQAACNGSTYGLVLVRVGTTTGQFNANQGSSNYTISLDCSEDCIVCPIDPELDILQQIENEKVSGTGPLDCDLAETVCDSPDSSSDSKDDARSDLSKMDEYDRSYKYEHNREGVIHNNGEKTYLLKVAKSVWINMYSFLAVMVLSCALFCVCMYRKK